LAESPYQKAAKDRLTPTSNSADMVASGAVRAAAATSAASWSPGSARASTVAICDPNKEAHECAGSRKLVLSFQKPAAR